MFDREQWGEVLQSIGKNKLRAVLTGFAVFWGIFMLIILLGAGAGLRNGFEYNFRNTATNSIRIWGNETSKPWKGLQPNRKIMLEEDDIEALRNAIPGIQHISGQYSVWRGESKLQYGRNSGSFGIRGIEPQDSHRVHFHKRRTRVLHKVASLDLPQPGRDWLERGLGRLHRRDAGLLHPREVRRMNPG